MNLNLALAKSAKKYPTTAQLFSSSSVAQTISSGISRQATTVAGAPESNMDKLKEPNPANEKPMRNVMSQSFGDGYSTRADEEGFGGIYSGNQSLNNIEADKEIHANHPDAIRMRPSGCNSICTQRGC
ncbi:hypothetical protein CRG98_034927 [Punica granatum]|uniref:Uncharacterized protein n=1 Tax=Punica granatum TaxID=22663 RepID=A0A2I0IL09_PUNGR|nr:hypothetical protein CRG98_034927 [Punica granatum]